MGNERFLALFLTPFFFPAVFSHIRYVISNDIKPDVWFFYGIHVFTTNKKRVFFYWGGLRSGRVGT